LQEVQFLPIVCDCLLRYFIPFGDGAKEYRDVNQSLIELMLADFCTWLAKKKLTRIQIALKKEYRLEVKPVPLPKHRISSHKVDHVKDKSHKESSIEESNNKKDHEIESDEEESEDENDSIPSEQLE
jgi:hypothetical protein